MNFGAGGPDWAPNPIEAADYAQKYYERGEYPLASPKPPFVTNSFPEGWRGGSRCTLCACSLGPTTSCGLGFFFVPRSLGMMFVWSSSIEYGVVLSTSG